MLGGEFVGRYNVIYGNTAKQALVQDYTQVLCNVSNELSESEYKHISDIASIGYECAAEKDLFVAALDGTISGWISETRRANLHIHNNSIANDIFRWYNTTEVKNMKTNKKTYAVIPVFFVSFGGIFLSLFLVFATIFTIGILQKSFFINPVYLFMFTIGFLGLFLTDIAAVLEWRKGFNVQKKTKL